MIRALIGTGTVAVACAAALGIVLVGQSLGVASPAPEPAAITSVATTQVCPALGDVAGDTAPDRGGTVRELVVDAKAAGIGANVAVESQEGTPIADVPAGQLKVFVGDVLGNSLARASGDGADRAQAAAAGVTARGPQRGLSMTQCARPDTQHWFVGLRSNAEERSALLLTNPDRFDAEVALDVYTADGVQAVAGTTGIAVAPGETRTVALESLLDSADPVAVSVRATAGRVAAVAELQAGSGDAPAGADWSISAADPAPTVIVPAVPGGDGSRELVVVNPSEVRATARVEVLGSGGPFPPADAESIEVGPGGVTAVELSTALARQAVAVRVIADQPVTAAVVSRSSGDRARADLALAPAADAFQGFALAPIAGWREHRGQLVVSAAGDQPAGFGWEAFGKDGGSLGRGRETLTPGSTRAIELPDADEVSVHVVGDPGSDLVAGVALAGNWENIATLAGAPLIGSRPPEGELPRFDPRVG